MASRWLSDFSGTLSGGSASTAAQDVIVAVTFDGTTGTATFSQNTLSPTATQTGMLPVATVANLDLGAWNGIEIFNTPIAEILICKRALVGNVTDDANRRAVMGILAARYGIALA